MTTERLSGLAQMNINYTKPVDYESVESAICRTSPAENATRGSRFFFLNQTYVCIKQQHGFNSLDMHRFVQINWNAPQQLLIYLSLFSTTVDLFIIIFVLKQKFA